MHKFSYTLINLQRAGAISARNAEECLIHSAQDSNLPHTNEEHKRYTHDSRLWISLYPIYLTYVKWKKGKYWTALCSFLSIIPRIYEKCSAYSETESWTFKMPFIHFENLWDQDDCEVATFEAVVDFDNKNDLVEHTVLSYLEGLPTDDLDVKKIEINLRASLSEAIEIMYAHVSNTMHDFCSKMEQMDAEYCVYLRPDIMAGYCVKACILYLSQLSWQERLGRLWMFELRPIIHYCVYRFLCENELTDLLVQTDSYSDLSVWKHTEDLRNYSL